jgi:hypothetical protein
METNEISIEAWITPANATQDGPSRIVTISDDSRNRNVTLAQGLWGDLPSSLYTTRLRTTKTDKNGVPALSTISNSLKPELSHVVYTRNSSGQARMYIDGQEVASKLIEGDFSHWNTTYALGLANEIQDDRPWLGKFHLVALYNQALEPAAVQQHFRDGPDGALQQALPLSPPLTPPAGEPSATNTIITNTQQTVSADRARNTVQPATTTPFSDSVNIPAPDTYFPLGVFEDAGMVGGDPETFRRFLKDIQSHGFDSVMFTNNYAARDAPMLEVSDELEVNVFMMPARELDKQWWHAKVTETLTTAHRIAEPIVELLQPHPSMRGYIVKDEPALVEENKVAMMTQAFRELDPQRPAMSILIGTDRVQPIFLASQPDVMLIDVYPAGYDNDLCDFTLTGFGYRHIDFVGYIRKVSARKPDETPLWIILQTHKYGDGTGFSLREPTPAEVRAQNWLAIGEGATGIFWFIYSSQQGWDGLVDNPPLYREVTSLALRVAPLRETLLQLQKGEDTFEVTGGERAYSSTLVATDGQKKYVVVVNRDCSQSQLLALQPANGKVDGTEHMQFRNLETSCVYEAGEEILFKPGDGKIFEVVTQE